MGILGILDILGLMGMRYNGYDGDVGVLTISCLMSGILELTSQGSRGSLPATPRHTSVTSGGGSFARLCIKPHM